MTDRRDFGTPEDTLAVEIESITDEVESYESLACANDVAVPRRIVEILTKDLDQGCLLQELIEIQLGLRGAA